MTKLSRRAATPQTGGCSGKVLLRMALQSNCSGYLLMIIDCASKKASESQPKPCTRPPRQSNVCRNRLGNPSCQKTNFHSHHNR